MKLPTDYQSFIHLSRYARWLPQENRRETWEETVERYIKFLRQKTDNCSINHDTIFNSLRHSILQLEVMPSMRCLMTAGPALERDNVCGYNCSYLPIDHPRAFDETLYILMCGVGVGFSVERQFINKLPEVNEHFEDSDTVIMVSDSKAGWARAYRELISMLYVGQVPKWDISRLRPAGAPLKTFGGRSSGPDPLVDLFIFTIDKFRTARGRRLTSLECHDLLCKIGSVVVVGGVRRSAMISLSNFSDQRMRHAKDGQWWDYEPQRSLSNNSICYTEKPDIGSFMREWVTLHESNSGERGIFNREAARTQVEKNNRRDSDHEFGTNPCSEIILRPFQFCNLTEAIIRADDDLNSIREKVKQAAILGTIQASLTNFKYLRKIWTTNTEEERLLGVSLTGIMDNWYMNGSGEFEYKPLACFLQELKQIVIDINKEWSDVLGIPQSTATTCVKPSGTVSQLVDSSSGIHPRFSPYYIRTIRGDKKDPLTQLMIDQGVPHEDCLTNPTSTIVFSFPHKSPEFSTCVSSIRALDQLRLWKIYQDNWCEHKPSITVYIKPNEWMEVGAWVWKNFDSVSGIAFLPYSDHSYQQAPYQEITEEQYIEKVAAFPTSIDWSKLSTFETTDHTKGSQELACASGICEIEEI